MTRTPNTHEIDPARIVADTMTASRVLVEAVRGHRAGGPLNGLALVGSSGVTDRGLALAAVAAVAHLVTAVCEVIDRDPEDYLEGWLAAADRDERDALAHLTEGEDP